MPDPPLQAQGRLRSLSAPPHVARQTGALARSTGWNHQGFHDHPWPTSKKADPLTKKLLALEVAKNPKAGALQLKVISR
ncbi:hypothetical protein PGTUg99_027282 [Puccinia graminis f. sp. tritici]|uniref:Uncharacterized protein n=1 Tax=Puccinia graminis f. sp. tritici TaxID=56615 RepID=A0A5B0S6Z4_PUCGR|nr:hypothetical protein PGTUg99_027282 [Puccinia graminis f. sp. tritici]